MTVYGYARVSSLEQNLDRQREALAGVDKLITEKKSGKNITDRPMLTMLTDELAEDGDVIRVKSTDRLARNTADLLEIAEKLVAKGVGLEFIDNPGMDIRTGQGEFMLTVMAAFAKFDRRILLERQREGVAIAKAKGVYSKPRPGAQKLNDEQKAEAQARRDNGERVADIAASYSVTRQAIYNVTHA